MTQPPFTQIPRADACPICGDVHAEVPQDEACPTHGHRLEAWPVVEDQGPARWRLECPTKGCQEGRLLE